MKPHTLVLKAPTTILLVVLFCTAFRPALSQTRSNAKNDGAGTLKFLVLEDAKGNTFKVSDFSVNYTRNVALYTADFDRTAVRIYKGTATVSINWADIAEIQIGQKKEEEREPKVFYTWLVADVKMKDGTARKVDLIPREIHGKLEGETFKINMEAVKRITPSEK